MACLVVGASGVMAPLLGGVLVPAPDLVLPLAVHPAGTASVPFSWPANLPSGSIFAFQFWIADASAPQWLADPNGCSACPSTARCG